MRSLKFNQKVISIFLIMMSSHVAMAGGFKPNEIIVKFKSEANRARIAMNAFLNELGVRKVKRLPVPGLQHLTLVPGTNVEAMVSKLLSDPRIEYAQPNYILNIPERSTRPYSALEIMHPLSKPPLQAAPADGDPSPDPLAERQYEMKKIHAVEAWTQFVGSRNLIVADVDTGIDYNHEDLADNLWRNPKPSDRDDVVGYDFVHDDGLPFDDFGHGTHTAGAIGAVGENGKGVSGVAQRVSIMALKFLDDQGSGTTDLAIRAIDYATEHGARVMNASWGGSENNPALKDAIERAHVKDVLFIAAAGNNSGDNDQNSFFPASFGLENIVVVAATDQNDELADFSNYGMSTVDLAAPGVNTLSTMPGNKYETNSGTSMATPLVTGTAALIRAKHPDWTFKQVKAALLSSVDPISSLSNKVATGGRLNVLKAISQSQ